jgi:5'-deoxynucleotidase YfbR-like HD superfamily hydrolase
MDFPDLSNSIFLNLMKIHRFSNKTLTKEDTDADHTIRMQLMALEIYRNVPTFDIVKTCFKILTHDLEETVICDIPRDVKYYNEEFLLSVRKLTEEMVDNYNFGEFIKEYMFNSKDDTIEGWIVKILDIVDAYTTMNNEAWKQHSKDFEREASKSLNWMIEAFSSFPKDNLPLYNYIAGVVNGCKNSKISLG